MKRIDLPHGLLVDHDSGHVLTLPKRTTHYVVNVLRFQVGDRFELIDGTGRVATAELLNADDSAQVRLQQVDRVTYAESPLHTTLFQAIPKGKRWEWLIEKATELGVHRIVPVHSEHTVVNLPDHRVDDRLERWQKKASSAARQSQRSVSPTILRPSSLADAIALDDADRSIVAHVNDRAKPLMAWLNTVAPIDSISIWIGPEGGFADDEIQRLAETGTDPIFLGPRILRADTAGIALLSILQSTRGDLSLD